MQTKQDTHVLVRQRIHQLWLAPRELRLALEHLDRLGDLALLQAELRERRHCRLALRVDPQGLVAASLSGADVLLPLVERETLVHEREYVRWGSGDRQSKGGGKVKRLAKWMDGWVSRRDENALCFLKLDGPVELLNGLLVSSLVQQELATKKGKSKSAIQPFLLNRRNETMRLTSNYWARSW